MIFLASVQLSVSVIGLIPISEGLSLMVMIGAIGMARTTGGVGVLELQNQKSPRREAM